MSDPSDPSDPSGARPNGAWPGGGSPSDAWTGPGAASGGPASGPPVQEAERGRAPIVVALVIVAILSGSALFASGFTLGIQQALAPGTPRDERALFDAFWEAYRKITTEYVGEVEPKDLVEGAIGGMFRAVDDPYSSYMTSEEYESSLGGISGEFEGVGAQMSAQAPSGESCQELGPGCALIVVDVIRDSPAEAAGLLARDQVTAVDGEPVEGSTLDDTVARVRGPRGTDVRLSLLRDGQPLELTITRDVVRTVDVEARILADGTVGYLDIQGFSGSAADDFREHLQQQLDAGLRRFVVDVRDDPGGFVDAAHAIASEFIASGPVYWEEYADGRQIPTDVTGDGIATDPGIAVAVLVNGGSASASEIVAGALQDTGRATLVGERTFGKGTIQQWHLLSNDTGGFRLSVAKWLTPDKRWIHGGGLTPDVVVTDPSPGTGDDPQLERALELLARPVDDAGSPPPGATAGSAAGPPSEAAGPSARPDPRASRGPGVSRSMPGVLRVGIEGEGARAA
jgi:carboxyl-terminal processing protease